MKRLLLKIWLSLSVILLVGSIYVYRVGRDYLDVKSSDFLGNMPSNIDRLKKGEGKIPFSFAFISDTEHNDSSEWLIKSLLGEQIDFLVFVGDFVNESILPGHKFFIYKMSKCNLKIPIFLVAANHDISAENDNNPIRFTKADFQALYGPINYSFIYNNCLFIFFSNIKQDDIICCNYLRKILSERKEDIKYTFIFCSTPLRKVLHKVFSGPYWEGDIDKLVDKYKVDYVISGDYHRHFELIDDKGIKYIVSGSGGSHFHGKTLFGRFRSGTKMTVYPNCVTEEILVCNQRRFTDNSIRHFIFTRIVPKIECCFWVLHVLILILLCNIIFTGYLLFKL